MSIRIENDERIDGIQGQIHLSLSLSLCLLWIVAGFLCTLYGLGCCRCVSERRTTSTSRDRISPVSETATAAAAADDCHALRSLFTLFSYLHDSI